MSQSPSRKRHHTAAQLVALPDGVSEYSRVLEAALDNAPDGVVVIDQNGAVLAANETATRLLGAGVSSRLPEDWLSSTGQLAEVLRGRSVADLDLVSPAAGGLCLRVAARPLEGPGAAAAVLILRSGAGLSAAWPASDVRWNLLEAVAMPVLALDRAGRIVYANSAAAAFAGCASAHLAGKCAWEVMVVPGEANAVRRAFARLRKHKLPEHYECCWAGADGVRRFLSWSNSTLLDPGGALEYVVSVGVDITAYRHAQEDMRQANDTLHAVIETSPLAIIAMDLEGVVKRWNKAAERIFGWSAAEAAGRLFPAVPENDLPFFHHNLRRIRLGQTIARVERQRLRKDGSLVDVELWNAPWCDASGAIIGAISVIADVTERKALEEQFRQSQKMEAVGRLAGGVAHDFNNLLTVITGYGHMLFDSLAGDPALRANVGEVLHAAESAATLTNQLLSFSRRQAAQPCPLDLNALVAGMDNMLHRLIGEDVELATVLHPRLPRVKLDPSQFQQVLMNLIVNARDAMPEGGRITISTASITVTDAYATSEPALPPGDYVCLTVADTGNGMDEVTRRRIFEPFFTTKARGKGTGLGLSTAYGIVKQSGGDIWVSSEPGKGAEFRIYLPGVSEAAAATVQGEAPPSTRKGTETVLVAEDDASLRHLIREVLQANGYHVLESGNVDEALRICEHHLGPVHLFLADLVMPRMSGRELAARASALRPDIKVLYTSGYPDVGALDPSAPFLPKPFSPDALLAKVRELLDT